jgi:hypothetical protein
MSVIDKPGATPEFIYFQYNPDTITRTLTPKHSKPVGNSSETFRLEGVPSETITIDIELDTTDQLEHPELLGQVYNDLVMKHIIARYKV